MSLSTTVSLKGTRRKTIAQEQKASMRGLPQIRIHLSMEGMKVQSPVRELGAHTPWGN